MRWENAGFEINWDPYPFETVKLFILWREYEIQIKNLRAARIQRFIERT